VNLHRLTVNTCVLLAAFLLNACSGSSDLAPTNEQQITPDSSDSASFAWVSTDTNTFNLVEGDTNGLRLPLQVNRSATHSKPIQLSVAADNVLGLTALFDSEVLPPGIDSTQITLQLGIDALPLQRHQRTVVVSATDGESVKELNLTLNVEPTTAPDIYLLIGQSNMVGFSGDDTKEAYIGGPDEPNPRIRQLNVTFNDELNQFTDAASFRSVSNNVISPTVVTAEDPLHESRFPDTTGKTGTYIGLGLSFAKAALPHTNADIVLVPAAWSGSAFCDNNGGPKGQWNATTSGDPALGNTWLFDRAVTRTNFAISETSGILRGILWHQGESDSNEACASSYMQNMELLAQQLRQQITPDQRGNAFRQANSPVPFIVGTMSRGYDDRGDLSMYSVNKQMIDIAHREIPGNLDFVQTSVHDDLVGSQWPCGSSTCIHFGAAALREIGKRYYTKLRESLAARL